jgi:hypothetical protein
MTEYADKTALAAEILKSAAAFALEFEGIAEGDRDLRLDGVDRTPAEMLAYQLGWLGLIRSWEEDEKKGLPTVLPAPGVKWNQMGVLYQGFYEAYAGCSLAELRARFSATVEHFLAWFEDDFTEDDVFMPGSRKWASSTPSNWPVWKWVHINTVAPYKTFRAQIRKWKKAKG